ncbi:hypothetical protein [Sphingomonas colocasiae]|uniref:DUF1428 family protein n=1 Tax=Sphingomonas colocasiae TaxID=1848973 RepID=A0ABS7PYQ7_9SPHN|nr:hypothetical protein [Sphingomonas colocasiae]MBY8826323.1 hypothetical protein [Sphingomonas colocasiae]
MIFIVPFHVKKERGAVFPDEFSGAYVNCYVGASDYKEAVKRCIEELKVDGMVVEKVMEPIYSMDISQWHQHILDQWPDYVNQLPNQDKFESEIGKGEVVYGPFGAY